MADEEQKVRSLEVERKLRELLAVVRDFYALLGQLAEQDVYIDNFRAMVRRESAGKYYKKAIALILALDLYKRLVESVEGFLASKQGYVERIKPFDAKLAEGITSLESPPTEEIRELTKCMDDIRMWPNYRLTNRIEFFVDRLRSYLRGGRDEINGDTYLGLASRFKDVELARRMMKVSQIKKIWTYKEEMEFFSYARAMVLQALRPGGKQELFWGTKEKDFKDGFYYDLMEGRRYIEVVREKFGNEEFANFLERLYRRIRQYPKGWEEELGILSERLHNITYQNMYVIEPAKQALLGVFNARVVELQSAKLTIQVSFARILKGKNKNLSEELASLREELATRSGTAERKKKEFVKGYLAFLETDMDFSKPASESERVYEMLVKASSELSRRTSSARNEVQVLQALGTHGTYMDNLEEKGAFHFSQMSLSAEFLEGIIAKLRSFINKLGEISNHNKEIIKFISGRLDEEFTIKLEDLKRMRLQFTKKVAEQPKVATA
ncbi:MAG: hypothetical protein Q8R04_07100 [Nanoarchaeota archaeon]|nr:hypothetical protein [Nanoarchaeota archaeon]